MANLTPQEQNTLMRELLKQNSPKILKKLPTVNGTLGGTTRIKLQNTGLITRLLANINIPYTTTVAPTNLGNKGAFAAVPKIQLLDFDGSSRINTSAYHLSVINAMRGRCVFGGDAFVQSNAGLLVSSVGMTDNYRNPLAPLTVAANTLQFTLEIPLAANSQKGDLRGMLAAQYVSGEIQLAIDLASTLVGTADDDYVFNGGTMTYGTPTITVFQEYYLPQVVRGVTTIPQMDVSTVYELGVYSRTTDNIAAGQEKFLNFPTVREVNGVVVDYLNNKLLGGGTNAADLQAFTIYANGNNVIYQTDQNTQNYIERSALNTDLPQGTFMFDFSAAPVSTALWGNVQLAVTPGTAPTTPAVEVTFESLYAKGSALTGTPV